MTPTEKLNRLLKTQTKKLAALEKIQGTPQERIQRQKELINKLKQEFDKLSPQTEAKRQGKKK